MTTALAHYTPPPAIAAAHAARGYPPLALAWHEEAMARRARAWRPAAVEMGRASAPTMAPAALPPIRPSAPPSAATPAVETIVLPAGISKAMVVIISVEASREWGISYSAIMGRRREFALTVPRHVAMYLAREMTPLSLPEIGRQFRGRDHTTVIHAIHATENRVARDPAFAARVEVVRERVEVALCERGGMLARRAREGG